MIMNVDALPRLKRRVKMKRDSLPFRYRPSVESEIIALIPSIWLYILGRVAERVSVLDA